MTSPVLLMLLERLLWPVPRVRWEAGRSLAHLIREGDREAANGLLNWISTRRLESEAVLGLGIIDAFDLGAYFEFTDVSKAVRAPFTSLGLPSEKKLHRCEMPVSISLRGFTIGTSHIAPARGSLVRPLP